MEEEKRSLFGRSLWLSSGIVLVLIVVALFYVINGARGGVDRGGNTQSEIPKVPTVKDDNMKAVGTEEADRRATVNKEQAEATTKGKSFVAQTVISDSFRAGDARDPHKPGKPQAQGGADSAAEPQIVYRDRIVYRDPPMTDPVIPSDHMAKIQSQIDYAQKLPKSNFVVMSFAKPEPKPAPQPSAAAGQGFPSDFGTAVLAKPGDIVYARLILGFNSDDPQAVVYATIFDNRSDGTNGPLHGSRVEGQVTYSQNQAAIKFTKLISPSGKITSVAAFAIDEGSARTGVARNVDMHTLERYGALALSSLLQGVGQVGQTLLTGNRTITYMPYAGTVTSNNNPVNWTQAGMAVVQPLGQELTSQVRQGMNRPPTIASPGGMGIGVVFTSEVRL